MLYGVAVLAAGMGAFGFIGLLVAVMVLWFWTATEHARLFLVRLFAYVVLPIAVGVFLFLPAVGSRPPQPVNTCRNNLREVALSLQMYAEIHGTFPPPYVAEKNGKPMYSWRVLIQPYLEREDIYKAYKFSEPWDGPNNRQLANVVIPPFQCPSVSPTAGETTVFAVVGPDAAWVAGRGRTHDEFSDGADQTLLLIEAVGRGVNWMEPKDLSYEEALALLTADNVKQAAVVHAREEVLHYTEYSRNVAFADGRVDDLPIGSPRELAEGLLTIDGGEQIAEWRDPVFSTPSRLHWPRLWGIAVFVVLAALPRVNARRRRAKARYNLPPTDAFSA
jgi:hypothetical protein